MDFNTRVSIIESKIKPNFKMINDDDNNDDFKMKTRSLTNFFINKSQNTKEHNIKQNTSAKPANFIPQEKIFQTVKLNPIKQNNNAQSELNIKSINKHANSVLSRVNKINSNIQNLNDNNKEHNNNNNVVIASQSKDNNNDSIKTQSNQTNTNVINNDVNENKQKHIIHQQNIGTDIINILGDKANKHLTEYNDMLNNNPNRIFRTITKETIDKWKTILIIKTTYEDQTISSITSPSEIKNVFNQDTIQKDINRTRLRERKLLPSFASQLPVYLTYYLKLNGIDYKQGLNEIIGAMLLIHYKHKLSFTETFNLMQGFISKFLTNYYRGYEMTSLKSSMSLIHLLLRYHNPKLSNLFESLKIEPTMYTLNWFMTTCAGKLHLHVLYKLWDCLITSNDNLMIHYYIIAFLLHNQDLLMTADHSFVVVILSQLSLYTEEEVDKIFSLALTIRNNTPYSFKVLANKLEIFKENSPNIKYLYNLIKPNEFVSLPIFPKELFYLAYNQQMKCPNEDCDNVNTINNNNNVVSKKGPLCDYCDLHIKKDIKFIFVDLRIICEKDKRKIYEFTSGFLPNMIMIEQSELSSSNIDKILAERFNKEKGKYHFVFVTSHTDYFKDYEDNFYNMNDPLNYMDNNVILPYYKVSHSKKLSIHKKIYNLMTKEEKSKLKEYNILKTTLETFTKHNIQYISFCYGGFASIHEESILYDITLLNHDSQCKLCNELRKSDNLKCLTKIEKMLYSKRKEIEKEEVNNVNYSGQEMKVFMNNTTEELVSVNKENNNINIGDITQFVCYSDFAMFFGMLKSENESDDIKQEIMVMVKITNILLYKFSQLSNEELNIIENIPIDTLNSILPIKRCKNIVVIKYNIHNNNQHHNNNYITITKTLTIDFLSETNSKKFIYAVNQRKAQST